MPSMDITFCSDGDKCRRRNTCFRWTAEHKDMELSWWSEFYKDSYKQGIECQHYMKVPIRKKTPIKSTKDWSLDLTQCPE